MIAYGSSDESTPTMFWRWSMKMTPTDMILIRRWWLWI